MENLFTGVIGNPLEDPKVQNGYDISLVLPESAPFDWNRTLAQTVSHPVWNQWSSSACVAFSKAKQVSIRVFRETGVWIDFSPASIYQLRFNKPSGGMNIADANDIVNNKGVTLDALMRSQNLTEEQINLVKRTRVADLVAKAFAEAVVAYLYVPVNIDRIAQTIQAGKAVSLLIFAAYDEYSREVPVVIDPNLTYDNAPIRHEIVAVDYFTHTDGTKRLKIEDSAHFGNFSTRYFTEDFLKKRCILADAIDLFTFDEGQGDKPRYDGTIISVQKCLKYEGLFPQEVGYIESFGPVTKNAVKKFQVKYGLHPTGVASIGPKTKAKLLELYP